MIRVTGNTHFLAGAAIGAAVGAGKGMPLIGMALGGMAALLPDIDAPGSLAGRALRPASVILETFGHRGITHTVWFAVATSLAFTALFQDMNFFWMLFAGGLSHIALDALTRSGVRPFLPAQFRLSGPFRTGSCWTELPFSGLALLMLIKELIIIF